jgi:lysophospholipase L1-like esterase
MKKILLTMCIALCLPVMCMAKERLVLIGDASLAPHSIANPDVRGWGEKLSALFTDKVEVLNFAQAGESTHTLVDGRLKKIINQCHSGDFVVLQLGQNDLRDEYGKMYYPAADMATQLADIVAQLQKKRVKVILCTPVVQPYYMEGQVIERMGVYADVIRRVAKAKETYLIDMEQLTKDWISTISEQNASLFFEEISADTQRREYLLTEAGATEVSRLFVEEVLEQKIKKLKKHVVLSIEQQ